VTEHVASLSDPEAEVATRIDVAGRITRPPAPTATGRAPSTTESNGVNGHLGTADVFGRHQVTQLERCAWSVVWLAVLIAGCDLWGSWWSSPIVDVMAPALVAVALAGAIMCWCSASPRTWWHQGTALAAGLGASLTSQAVGIHASLYYSTDSAALDQVAARVLVRGHDPYTSSLTSAAALLKTPAHFWTYTVNGGHIVNMSYPAGSFLVYALGWALGFHHAVVDWVDLFAWVTSIVVLFFLVPRPLRWLAALVAMTGYFAGSFAGGSTDALFIPLAMVAVWRWDRYGLGREAGLARWIGPVALGLACSIKQTPWFCIPFLLVGIYIETRRSGRRPGAVLGRYVATLTAVFAAVNLPFVVWGPSAWWHGVLTPMSQPLVADGQGLVSLALHGITGGADLRLLMVASFLALLALLAAFVAWYHRLKRLWPLLLPIAFFFSPRSFSSYLIDLFPVALVAVLTTTPAPKRAGAVLWGRVRGSELVVAILAVATALAASLSLAGGPLVLGLRSASIGRSQEDLRSVTVWVDNPTDGTVVPHFLVAAGAPHPTGFWKPGDGRTVVLGPHRSATLTLFPPTPTYLPRAGSDYVVQAYTSDPSSLSTTSDIWHDYTSPARH
jgi:hypothetical protein